MQNVWLIEIASSLVRKTFESYITCICCLIQEMTDYGGGIHLVKAAFPFNGRDEDEVPPKCCTRIYLLSPVHVVGFKLDVSLKECL